MPSARGQEAVQRRWSSTGRFVLRMSCFHAIVLLLEDIDPTSPNMPMCMILARGQ